MSSGATFEIGENIKKLREFRGYSQDYMAKELKVSQKTYSNIESDKGKVNKNQIKHIAEILEIDPVYLLTYDDKVVFNNENSAQTGGMYTSGIFNNNYNVRSEVEQDLYEKRIEEMKERIEEMKKEIEFLRSMVKK